MLELGTFSLGSRPCLVAAARDDIASESIWAALGEGVSAIEWRLDLFRECSPDHAANISSQYAGIPSIATVRLAAEGGGWRASEEERRRLYEAVLPHVSAVDIEIAALGAQREVVQAAHTAGKLVIGSFHDFQSTPAQGALMDTARRGCLEGADLVKVACVCAGPEDMVVLTRFLLDVAPLPVAVMAMGHAGILSRLFFPALGSLLTYTYLGSATAPGQLTYREMLRYLEGLYPECARAV